MERYQKDQSSFFPSLDPADVEFRRFEHAKKKKFWEVHLGMTPGGRPRRYTRAGALGTPGKEVVAYFQSEREAERNVEKMIEAKLAGGYLELKLKRRAKKS